MATTRSTVRDLRRRNRSAVLRRLLFDGSASRAELSRDTGLSLATVGNVTTELIADRLIVEAGLVESDGGRPRALLCVDSRYGTLIGVDVGDHSLTVELFDLNLNRLSTVAERLHGPGTDPASVASQLAVLLHKAVARAGVAESGVLGVGVAVPGAVEQGAAEQGAAEQGAAAQGKRTLVHAQVIGWDAVPFEELLRAAGVRLPLYFDNVARTQAQAEMWFGAGRGARHAVIALVCSGVGAAVIANGATYQGATSSGGEWGHTTIDYGGRLCRCGARGCLEAYVGAEAILSRYRRARGGRPLPGDDEHAQLAAMIAAAPHSPAADRVLRETAGYLGAGLANLVNLFNPERIVLAGWAGMALGRLLLPEIKANTAAYALGHSYQQTTIELGVLGPDSVALSAATLPLAALLAHGGDPRGDHRRTRTRTAAQIDAA